jgi:hypothetical protein
MSCPTFRDPRGPALMSETPPRTMRERFLAFAPGLAPLLSYRRSDLPHDVMAGLSVAAVAVPVRVAYAELVGLERWSACTPAFSRWLPTRCSAPRGS